MASVKGEKRDSAISHAIRTTGTLVWCGTGVYSGDGKRALDPMKLHSVAEETRRYISAKCSRFTQSETLAAKARKVRHELRLRRLAHMAIDAGKYESARTLLSLANDARDEVKEYEQGERIMFWIKDECA